MLTYNEFIFRELISKLALGIIKVLSLWLSVFGSKFLPEIITYREYNLAENWCIERPSCIYRREFSTPIIRKSRGKYVRNLCADNNSDDFVHKRCRYADCKKVQYAPWSVLQPWLPDTPCYSLTSVFVRLSFHGLKMCECSPKNKSRLSQKLLVRDKHYIWNKAHFIIIWIVTCQIVVTLKMSRRFYNCQA